MQVKKAYRIVVKALQPLLVGGRSLQNYYHASSSNEAQKWIITASSIKGAVTEHLKNHSYVLGEELVKKLCGAAGDGRKNEGSFRFSDLVQIDGDIHFPEEVRTRVKINPSTGSAETGSLFVFKCAPKGTSFEGLLLLDEKLSEGEIQAFLDFLKGHNTFHVGGSRTVGFGLVELTIVEEEHDLRHTLKPGSYLLFYKPLSPFVSTEAGFETLAKRYYVPSKNYIPASAMKTVLKLDRVGFFYPAEEKSKVYPIPPTFLSTKHGRSEQVGIYDVLIPLVKNRMNGVVFKIFKDGQRLVTTRGYVHVDGKLRPVKLNALTNFHVAVNELTRTVNESFWVQRSYKPNYWVGFVHTDSETSIPKYITVGGARGKGYGLMVLEGAVAYDTNHWKRSVQKFNTIFNDPDHVYVPILFTSPYYCEDVTKDFHAELFDSYVESFEYRFFDPDRNCVKIMDVVAPGSVIVLRFRDQLDRLIERLLELKRVGVGKYTEIGFGDFEVYPLEVSDRAE